MSYRDLYVIVRNLPDDNALRRNELTGEERRWGLADSTGVVTQLLALVVEGVNDLVWQNTKDGHANRNRPDRIPRPGVAQAAKPPTRQEIDEFDRWYAQRFNATNN